MKRGTPNEHMSNVKKQRAGKERIESLGIPKSRFTEWWRRKDKADWAARIGIAVAAAIVLLVVCRTWRPPFAYRVGTIPARDLVTRVTFQVPDKAMTDAVRRQKRQSVLPLYRNRIEPIKNLRGKLKNQLSLLELVPSFNQMSPADLRVFSEFYEGDEAAGPGDTPAERFAALKAVLSQEEATRKIDEAIGIAMLPVYERGLLQGVQHTELQGSQRMIRVYPAGQPDAAEPVELSKVLIAQARTEIESRLREQFRTRFESEAGQKVARMISDWISARLPEYETLQYDDELSEKARLEAEANVEPVMTTYYKGTSTLADAGSPLSLPELALLRREWQELTTQMRWGDRLARVAAYAGMIAALYLLCGSYIYFVDDRSLILDQVKLAKLAALFTLTVSLGYFASRDQWRGELVPLVLASIIAAVVYGRELALLLMAAACLSMTLFLGADLADLVMMAAACTSCTLLLGRIRNRTHLLYVGAISAAITVATVVGVGIVTGQTISGGGGPDAALEPLYRGPQLDTVVYSLLREALWAGGCILVSATAMTGLLPLVEKTFGVQTDLSLLELGDASHPLLRRLAQRAPGTYNHSINVASIGEAAADAIGANGLLVRVGAYFHDIGKMFKPEYFIENQSSGINQHDSLQPAMSTLVIIAHVKDGADLARNHHLPAPLIDFILQHHGTTLVEYFYREAAKRSEEDPNGESVSDKDFRYPGPKPQTLEAAVLMLADTVESASRALVDPTPARIHNLVDAITQKKVSDGQFDECGLTFRQLHRIRQSLVKSLTAIYHARVKYPGQQSA